MTKKRKNSSIVSMTKSVFVKEHKKLIPLLRKGSKNARMKEADEQANELNQYL